MALVSYEEGIKYIKKCQLIENFFVCAICIEYTTSSQDALKLHYINKHDYKSIENKNLSKTCKICSQTFQNSKIRNRHVKIIHHKIKNYCCSICSKTFSRKSTLDIHLRMHSSTQTLVCPNEGCSFEAADPSVISKHRKLHQKTNEGKYKCPACEYFAIQTTGFKNHMMSKHPAIFVATMKCSKPNCDFVSINPERLRRHTNDHDRGLLDKVEEIEAINQSITTNLEISSDCFSIPIDDSDSIANHSLDTGGVTIIHTSNSSNVHSEDTVF